MAESGPLVRIGDEWQYWKGTNEPAGIALEWTGVNFRKKDTWAHSPSGFGSLRREGASEVEVLELEPLSDHRERYASAYFRREFTVINRASIRWLTLRLDFQEGCVVYINGREQLRVNLPGQPGQVVPAGTVATRREDSGAVEFDLSGAISSLRDGINVLAIQVHSDRLSGYEGSNVSGGDLLCVPELLANVTRGPIVQNTKTDSTVVMVRTAKAARVTVDYGVSPTFGRARASAGEAEDHEFLLTELSPDTRYFYRVRVSSGGKEMYSTTNTFRTFKERGDIRFSVIGSTGSGSLAQLKIAQQLAATPADLVLHCGDLIHPRFETGRMDARFLSPFGTQMRSVPYFLSAGSMDVSNSGSVGYLTMMSLPTNGLDGVTQWSEELTEPESYYSFDHGDVHFVCVYLPGDGEHRFDTNSIQYRWLNQDLARTRKPWKVLFQHEPIRSSIQSREPRASTNRPPALDWEGLETTLLPLAAKHGVALILAGRDRCYERFSPLEGVHLVTTGGGGMPLDELRELDTKSSLFLAATHFLNVQVQGDSMTIRAVDTGGTVLDEWQIRRQAPSRSNYPAIWSSPYLEVAESDDDDGNVIGQVWDARWELRDPEIHAIPSTTGLFSNLGRLRCAWDRTNLYFGIDRLMLPPGAEAVLFLEVPNQTGVATLGGLGNARLDPDGQGVDGLDAMWQMRFANFTPCVAMLFGDEFADGNHRDFLRDGSSIASGEGIFWLRPGYPDVTGARLQQFNRASQIAPSVGEQNANYVEASIPAAALGGLNPGQNIRVGVVCVGPISQQEPLSRELDDGFMGAGLERIGDGVWSLSGIEIRLPEDEDLDLDGLSEFEETEIGTNPRQADSDGDGLLDGWEYVHRLRTTSGAGASGANGDPDGDGIVNLDEQKLGTSPRRKNSIRLEARRLDSGEIELKWPALAIGVVSLEMSPTLAGAYVSVGRFVGDSGRVDQTIRIPAEDGTRVFRLRILPPGTPTSTSRRSNQ